MTVPEWGDKARATGGMVGQSKGSGWHGGVRVRAMGDMMGQGQRAEWGSKARAAGDK